MSRVNWEARSDYEYIANYKLLQNAFTKHNVQRHVDVNKLIRAKYQDNLEFCQWMKAFFDQTGAHREDYDGKAVRARGKGGKKYNQQQANAGPPVRSGSRGRAGRVTAPSRPAPTTTSRIARSISPQKKAPLRENNRVHSQPRNPDPELTKKNKELEAKNAELETKKAEMELKIGDIETAMVELEKERDFYFGKLRSVELMLQVQQDKNFEGADLDNIVEKIFKVLYATAEEDINIDDDGDIVPVADAEDPLNTTNASEPVSVAALEDEVF
jgi:RP/EB family microtubule-associated protein